MENQTEKKAENDMKAGWVLEGFGFRASFTEDEALTPRYPKPRALNRVVFVRPGGLLL